MFLRCTTRKKNGKEHCYWSIVENKRCASGKIVQRHVLYLGAINGQQQALFEARADAPVAVDLVLAAIQKLYRIEARAKVLALSLEAHLELRQREAKPIFLEVGQLIATMRKDVLPKSPLGQALAYAENRWPAMARYLEVA